MFIILELIVVIMITLISAVTTTEIMNVTTKVIATAASVESSSSDPSSTAAKTVKDIYNISFNVDLIITMYRLHSLLCIYVYVYCNEMLYYILLCSIAQIKV